MKLLKTYKLFEHNDNKELGDKLVLAVYHIGDKNIDEQLVISDLKKLLDQGADINYQNVNGWTALIHAALYGKSETVKYLINAGADLNLLDKKKRNALMEAAWQGYLDVAEILVYAGSELNNKDIHGKNFIDLLANRILNYNLQKYILSKEPSLYKSFIENDISIHPDIMKEMPYLETGENLNLL